MKKHVSKVRVFKNNFLESLTHVNPIVPICLWLPIFCYILSRVPEGISLREKLIIGFLGLLLWTFVEYCMHRFLFHFETKNSLGKRFVYIMHGLHHDDPQDPTRLLMPPVPGIIYATFFYFLFSFTLGPLYIDLFFAFFLLGYIGYDYIHFGIHHFPMKGAIGKYLRKHHLTHHVKDSCKYGVTSPLWDKVFMTYQNDFGKTSDEYTTSGVK